MAQQSHPQSQSQQSQELQQSPQLLQQSHASQQSLQSHWLHSPSRRCRLHGSSKVPQHIWQVQARPAHTRQPVISPRRSRGGSGGGWGGPNGLPGLFGAYGLPGGGPKDPVCRSPAASPGALGEDSACCLSVRSPPAR